MNGIGKSFDSEKSKYSCRGERMSSDRGALPSDPLTGRMNAAGLMKGSQPDGGAELPVGQSRFHRGLRSGTPGTRSGLTYRLKSTPPSLFGSVMKGRKGNPPGMRRTPETIQPPASALTKPFGLLMYRRPRPKGMSQIPVAVKLCLRSKVESA